MVELVSREGRSVFVKGLDAIDGTPVVDIKPVMEEFCRRRRPSGPNGLRTSCPVTGNKDEVLYPITNSAGMPCP